MNIYGEKIETQVESPVNLSPSIVAFSRGLFQNKAWGVQNETQLFWKFRYMTHLFFTSFILFWREVAKWTDCSSAMQW